MRKTVTLDDDIAATIETLRLEGKLELREIINQALRFGLRQLETESRSGGRFQTTEVSLGRCRLGDLVSISEAVAVAEGEAFK